MLSTRRHAAQTVFDHLKSAERSTDLALAETAELAAAMLRARLAINVAPLVGQEAFELVVETFKSQADSRRQLIATHARLADVKIKLGLREVAIGGLEDKQVPEPSGIKHGVALSVVQANAA
ncbi:MAG: hypothetical protein JWM38_1336 [Sphingomonas bacterium]|jgi:hypothetical protein|nr:hypothetical protein [Sphingomonas bacterium]MDB5684132.1 hypothetical protein [Sphingomonas bacterium]MDB5717909.1 hypothetical protein [Sphingomonas bacterium]